MRSNSRGVKEKNTMDNHFFSKTSLYKISEEQIRFLANANNNIIT